MYTPFLPLQRGLKMEKASELQGQPLTHQRAPQGPTPQQLPSSWVCSGHGRGLALPAHPHCDPEPLILPYIPLLRLGGLPRGQQCASSRSRPLGLALPQGFLHAGRRKEVLQLPTIKRRGYISGSQLKHPSSRGLSCTTHPWGLPTPPSHCAASAGAPIGQGAL